MMDDRDVVTIQIGRPPRSAVSVVARCHLGLPIVIDVPPILDDGTPFPTMHWLTCPLATVRVSRIESTGGVRAADELVRTDADVREAFGTAMSRYEQARNSLVPAGWTGPVPSGGIAGSSGGVKCLHAQYADSAAGNDNPIGATTALRIEPLTCSDACVIEVDGVAVPNVEWVEPR
jgi:hypothetical protein